MTMIKNPLSRKARRIARRQAQRAARKQARQLGEQPLKKYANYDLYQSGGWLSQRPALTASSWTQRMLTAEDADRASGVSFDLLTERLALGGEVYGQRGVERLRQAGITHVINCQQERDDSPLWAGAGMANIQLGTGDDFRPKPESWFEAGKAFARQALADPQAKLYVHCHMGYNRAPSMALAILVDQGMSEAAAVELIHRVRPQAWPVYRSGGRVSQDAEEAI